MTVKTADKELMVKGKAIITATNNNILKNQRLLDSELISDENSTRPITKGVTRKRSSIRSGAPGLLLVPENGINGYIMSIERPRRNKRIVCGCILLRIFDLKTEQRAEKYPIHEITKIGKGQSICSVIRNFH